MTREKLGHSLFLHLFVSITCLFVISISDNSIIWNKHLSHGIPYPGDVAPQNPILFRADRPTPCSYIFRVILYPMVNSLVQAELCFELFNHLKYKIDHHYTIVKSSLVRRAENSWGRAGRDRSGREEHCRNIFWDVLFWKTTTKNKKLHT